MPSYEGSAGNMNRDTDIDKWEASLHSLEVVVFRWRFYRHSEHSCE